MKSCIPLFEHNCCIVSRYNIRNFPKYPNCREKFTLLIFSIPFRSLLHTFYKLAAYWSTMITFTNSALSNWAEYNQNKRIHFEELKLFQAQEDEKSLCQSDWSADASLDQPSYGSIVLQLKEANKESESSCDFLRKFIDIVQNTSTDLIPFNFHTTFIPYF